MVKWTKKQTVAVVANANAGKHTPRAGLGLVIGSILATPLRTYNTESLAALDKAAEALHHDRPDILVIAGGDGTVTQTLTRVLREHEREPDRPLPQFLVIPTGTVNNLGTALGMTRLPAIAMAERIAQKIRHRIPLDVAHLNPLRVNDEYGFLYGAGLPVNLLERYYADPRRGPRGAVRVILATLRNELFSAMTFRKSRQMLTKPVHAKVTLPDGHDPPVGPYMTHTGLMCGAIDQVGFGCRALPDAMTKPDHFMLRSSSLSFWGYVAAAGPVWAGLSIPHTFDAVVPSLTVEYEEPTVTTVDGELLPPTLRDVITSGPMLTFITG